MPAVRTFRCGWLLNTRHPVLPSAWFPLPLPLLAVILDAMWWQRSGWDPFGRYLVVVFLCFSSSVCTHLTGKGTAQSYTHVRGTSFTQSWWTQGARREEAIRGSGLLWFLSRLKADAVSEACVFISAPSSDHHLVRITREKKTGFNTGSLPTVKSPALLFCSGGCCGWAP